MVSEKLGGIVKNYKKICLRVKSVYVCDKKSHR